MNKEQEEMKITIDMENLASLIEQTMDQNIENVVRKEVQSIVHDIVQDVAIGIVDEVVNAKVKDFIEDYIKTTTITIGGGLYSSEPQQTYTIEEYTRKTLSQILESQMITKTSKGSYGSTYTEKVSFDDYVKNKLCYDTEIQKHLDQFATAMKKDVSNTIKNTFDNATKNALSESVFNLLISTDTYQKIVSGVNLLAGN